ncbi:DUF2513 domain-containing protein [Vibrio parahaemolyticus]|uniref:hypothetical protein n=1 Tax=Vibrio parahaemolyticus TaxID=670 RepID=UPI002269A335|nr:hypothetical protein [Vibrio parahaemolyticus]EHK0752609.1 DUF2513 domain-containing protein [Vibrio parahaemolyticus]MCX8932100.1 DUF2513 domain-containing protein [Vibrio parahaemolyticus]
MDIDYQYLKSVLLSIKERQRPYARSKEFCEHYLNEDKEKFIYHIHLIIENQLISTNLSSIWTLKDLGIVSAYQDPMRMEVSNNPIRLTSTGLDFLSALEKPDIFSLVTSKLKDEGVSAVIEVCKPLLVECIKKKVNSYLPSL